MYTLSDQSASEAKKVLDEVLSKDCKTEKCINVNGEVTCGCENR